MVELKLTVYSPERKVLESCSVTEVTLMTSEGQVQILPGHARLIGVLETGVFHYSATQGGKRLGVISSGFFEVGVNEVSVVAQTLEFSDEINLGRAKEAQKRAEEKLNAPNLDESSFKKYQLKMQRALIRQQIAK